MFSNTAKASWSVVDDKAAALEPGSLAALEVLREDARNLPEDAAAGLAGLLTHQVEKRLQLGADRKANPAIAEERIARPIVIVGMPRSGTSLLHALLSTDPDNRAVRSWALAAPSPPNPDAAERARRVALSKLASDAYVAANPEILKLHPYWDEGGEATIECEDIMQMSLISSYFPAFFRLRAYDEWLATADFTPAFRVHHEFLQHLQWRQPQRRWVLKGVTHVEHLDTLLAFYPDALLVWPHRDPVDQMASMSALVGVTRRAQTAEERAEIFRYLLKNTARGMEAALAHPASRDGRILHVPFSRLQSEPLRVVADIYARIGNVVSPTHDAAMTTWLSAPQNDPARHGRASTDLAHFGATGEDVHRRFAAYYDSGLLEADTATTL